MNITPTKVRSSRVASTQLFPVLYSSKKLVKIILNFLLLPVLLKTCVHTF